MHALLPGELDERDAGMYPQSSSPWPNKGTPRGTPCTKGASAGQAEEAHLVQEAKGALVAQPQALAEEPEMLFALGQPRHNAVCGLPEATAIVEGQSA